MGIPLTYYGGIMFKSLTRNLRALFRGNNKGAVSSFTLKNVRDWRIQCGESVPDHHGDYYDIEVSPRDGASLDVCVTHRRYPAFGLSLIIEINHGVPCLHVTNDVMGDNVIHLFATQQGVAVVPEYPSGGMERQSTGFYYPGCADRDTLFYRHPVDEAPGHLDGRAMSIIRDAC